MDLGNEHWYNRVVIPWVILPLVSCRIFVLLSFCHLLFMTKSKQKVPAHGKNSLPAFGGITSAGGNAPHTSLKEKSSHPPDFLGDPLSQLQLLKQSAPLDFKQEEHFERMRRYNLYNNICKLLSYSKMSLPNCSGR